MRYVYSATTVATILLAFHWQGSASRAGDSPAESIGRLKLLAFWDFDEDQGRVLLDETESFFGLSQGGVSFAGRGVMERPGNDALSFDGRGGRVVVRHREELLVDQGSIALWFRADDVTRAQALLSKDANGFGDGGHLTISLGQGQIAVRLQSATDSHELRAAASKHHWTHVAFTFGSAGMRLYVDGKLAGTNAYQGGLGQNSGGQGNHEPLVFGASTMTSQPKSELPLTSFFAGEIDEVAIIARQFAAGEVAELVNAAAPQYKSLVRAYVANRPSAWWRLNEPSGDTLAIDQVGQQHGTYNVVGSSLFDGDDFIDLGALDLDDASFTILAYVEPKSFAVSDARILAKENGVNEADQFWSLSTTIREDLARLRFRLRTEHGTREAVSKNRNIQVNVRVFVAAVYDGQKMRLYQDGELVSEVPHRGRPLTNSHCHVWIGDSPSGAGNRPFDGGIQDVAILREAISADRISAIFQSARDLSPPSSRADLADAAAPPESLPLPPAGDPAPTEAPPTNNANRDASPDAFVHRCPLCDVRYREVVIHRVTLPGTFSPSRCATPHSE